MILAFNPQFVEPILAVTKIHTLRLDSLERWAPYKLIHFATGVRTKKYNCFKKGYCEHNQRVVMGFTDFGVLKIQVAGTDLTKESIAYFIKNDGFANETDFINWFWPKGNKAILILNLIHWTDFKY